MLSVPKLKQNSIYLVMRVLLTDNAPVGMLHLASIEGIITDFFPCGTYHDDLFEIKEYLCLCAKVTYDNAIIVSNKTPWSDLIWSKPNPDSPNPRQQDIYDVKSRIYDLCGWKPDAVINIYDKEPNDTWRSLINSLSEADPNLSIISLNINDPKFARNIVETINTLRWGRG